MLPSIDCGIFLNCDKKAIEYLATNPSDGYIIDFKMPKMNGIEFYKFPYI